MEYLELCKKYPHKLQDHTLVFYNLPGGIQEDLDVIDCAEIAYVPNKKLNIGKNYNTVIFHFSPYEEIPTGLTGIPGIVYLIVKDFLEENSLYQ